MLVHQQCVASAATRELLVESRMQHKLSGSSGTPEHRSWTQPVHQCKKSKHWKNIMAHATFYYYVSLLCGTSAGCSPLLGLPLGACFVNNSLLQNKNDCGTLKVQVEKDCEPAATSNVSHQMTVIFCEHKNNSGGAQQIFTLHFHILLLLIYF